MNDIDRRRQGIRRALRIGTPFAAGAAAGAAVLAVAGGTGSSAAPPGASAQASTPSRTAVVRTGGRYDARAIYARDDPGVVQVDVTDRAPEGAFGGLWPFMPGGRIQAEGAGFVYDRSGDIVTAAHVVSGATRISVTFSDGKTVSADLVGADPSSDTAVIRVNVPTTELTPLALGDSSTLAPGDGVVAIGSPFGYANSISAGIVSAVGRGIQAPNGYTIPDAIQTDAAINHGNSGGPLIDSSGHVVGVDVQIATDGSDDNSGVGFAVPSDTVGTVAGDLIAGRAVAYPYLGVSLGGSSSPAGARVEAVKAGSPAATAGLKAGDVITAADGANVASADGLTALVARHRPGDTLHLTVDRNGATLTPDATLGTRPAATTT